MTGINTLAEGYVNEHQVVPDGAAATDEHGTYYTQVRCTAPGCSYVSFGHFREGADLRPWHTREYDRGRVPDIEVDWTATAWCPVCEEYHDLEVDADGLTCPGCRSSWAMNGASGTMGEPEE